MKYPVALALAALMSGCGHNWNGKVWVAVRF